MLQKTLLNIEGLGRELDPDLDLWRTAKPYLERWMNEQIGWRGLRAQPAARGAVLGERRCRRLPRLVHRALAEDRTAALRAALERLAAEQRAAQPNPQRLVSLVAALALALLAFFLLKNGL